MAGRCGCSSAALTGCSLVADSPLDVAGAGTIAAPFEVSMLPSFLPLIVCTTTTRPTPRLGQTIYETDDLKFRGWNGFDWVQIGNPSMQGSDTPLFGSAPALGSIVHVLPGSPFVLTDAAGNATVDFPVPFPNALLAFVFDIVGTTTEKSIIDRDIDHVDIHINGAIAGQSWRVSYIAFGW